MILARFIRWLFRWLPMLIFLGVAWWLLETKFNWFQREEEPEVTVKHETVLQEIESMGRLELVRYRFKDIVELKEKNSPYLGVFDVPDSKVALITVGEATGCIDLRKITSEDVIFQGDTILIHLPQPELCYYKLDLSKSRVYSIDKQVYFKEDSKLLEKAYKKAEEQMRTAALKSGILNQTRENAEQVLRPLLEKVSGRRIIFLDQLPPQETTLERKGVVRERQPQR